MSRYLVTGATGFLGRHLVAQLLERSHDVVAVSRARSSTLPAKVTQRIGDILHHDSIADAAAGCDGAFHCAGKVSRDPADAEDLYRLHVDGTKTTLAALERAGVRRVVIASTSGTLAISADKNAVATEDTPPPIDLIARWPYYRSKLYAERAALDHTGNLEIILTNPSLLLGPGDLRDSSTEDVRKFLERKIPFTPAGGAAFVDARDAATALILAMDRGRPRHRYLINAANMSLEAFFGRLSRISNIPAPPIRLPRTSATLAGVTADLMSRAATALNMKSPLDRISAEMSQFYWYCDATKATRDLSWFHRDPTDTLSDTIADLRDRGVVWPP